MSTEAQSTKLMLRDDATRLVDFSQDIQHYGKPVKLNLWDSE